MKKLISVLLLAAAAMTASAQTSTGAPSDTEQSKASGVAIASQMRGSSPVIVNGALQTDGTNATMGRTNSSTGASQMDYFKSTTGFNAAVQTGNGRDGTIGANASSTTNIDFSCVSEANARKTSGGYVFQLKGCALAGTSVTSVTLTLCSATTRGGICSDASSFTAPTTVPANTYATVEDVKLGLGCNDTTSVCRLSVTSEFKMSTSMVDYKQTVAAKTAVTNQDANSAQGTIVAMRTKQNADGSNAYDSAMADQGQANVDCVQKNNTRLAAGQSALTCDGQTAANVSASPANSLDCSVPPQCVRTATKTTSFTRSCTRTFPLTAKVCGFETKTLACDITFAAVIGTDGKPTGASAEVSSCSSDALTGGTKFGSKTSQTCGVSHLVGTDTVCDSYNRTDYYSWAPQQVGACHGDPYTVGSSCVTDPAYVDTQCTSGQWFGRTKTALECIVVNMQDPASLPAEVGANVIEGCGVCQASQQGATCYAATPLTWGDPNNKSPVDAQDTCGAVDLTGCALSGTQQVVADGSGLVTSQQENYTCSKQAESCVETKQNPNCTAVSVNTFGLENIGARAGTSDDAMNQGLANVAIIGSIGGAATNADGSTAVPLLFGGTAAHCQQPTGAWGSNGYYMDCCKISLTRPGGKFGKLNACTEDDARLAAARRANYTHYIDYYCSKKSPWPLKKCIQNTQGYCAFAGVLPRLIQEQGRKQLAQMVQQDVTAQMRKSALVFDYYGTTGTWTAPIAVNGISVAAYQWPAYCRDLATAEKALEADPMAKECPTQLVNYFAVCDSGNCGPLPEYPEFGAESWVLTNADPLKADTTAVSRYAVVTGACDPATSQCKYEVSAWPAGVGGRSVVSKQISFPVYAAIANAQGATSVLSDLVTVGDYMFRPSSTVVSPSAYPTQLPTTVRMNFSRDGGQSWNPLDIPTGNNNEIGLPGTDAVLSGSCSLDTNLCRFKMTGTATVTALPWGSAQDPNCSGFTAGQLSALNFAKMDFSEWLSTVVANVKSPDGGSLSSLAQGQMSSFNQSFKGGAAVTVTGSAPQGYQVAKVAPSEGFGPFVVTLKVGGYWPMTYGDPAKDTDAVLGVAVDWGDCTAPEQATFVATVNGQAARGFLSQHAYTRPQDVAAACGGGATNLVHTLALKVTTTKSGIQPVTLQVKNAFDTMPGAYSINGAGTAVNTPTVTTTIPGKTTPPAGP